MELVAANPCCFPRGMWFVSATIVLHTEGSCHVEAYHTETSSLLLTDGALSQHGDWCAKVKESRSLR